MPKRQVLLGQRDLYDLLGNRASVEVCMSAGKYQRSQTGCANKIGQTHQHPVPQHVGGADFAVSPCQSQKVITGKKLGSCHHNQQQTQRKNQPAQYRASRKTQCWVRFHEHVKKAAQADECTCEHAQHQKWQRGHACLGNTDRFDALCDFAWGVRI